MKLIGLNTLNQMFENSADKAQLLFNGLCQSCGHDVTIEIHHHSAGFGFLGGVLYEQGLDQLIAKCEKCYQVNNNPVNLK